jgi:5-methylcytosine-specific restriction endonuclease McrA
MSDVLNKASVLVLNRNWQAIHVRTPAEAFCQMATDVASGLDIDGDKMVPVKWADWLRLPIRAHDLAVGTPRGPVRTPTVIVLGTYAKVPKRRPALSPKTIWQRDGGHCQYTGRPLEPHEANIDHVIPRSRGGATAWDNCVLADKRVNSRKADKLPGEAGLRLLRAPKAPPELPVTLLIRNHHQIGDWDKFLTHV